MAKIHNYKIDSLDESFNASVNVTSYPVEKGLPLNDGVQRNPKTYSISGKILDTFKNKNSEAKRKKLEDAMNKGTLVKYVGRIKAANVLITSFNGSYNSSIANGFNFNMELQQVRVATTPRAKKKTTKKKSGKKTVTKKKSSTSSNKKQFHVINKGDTYWSVAKKYGTTVAALRKLNPWPDRKIPIGAKMRIR